MLVTADLEHEPNRQPPSRPTGQREPAAVPSHHPDACRKGLLLRQIVAIPRGRSGTKGRTGLAPYNEGSKTKRARAKHTNVLPPTFATVAEAQLASHDKAPKIFEFDKDRLAQEILKDMVLVVPDELVSAVRKELKGSMVVEGGGMTSTQVKPLMDAEGFTVSKNRGDDDDPDYRG